MRLLDLTVGFVEVRWCQVGMNLVSCFACSNFLIVAAQAIVKKWVECQTVQRPSVERKPNGVRPFYGCNRYQTANSPLGINNWPWLSRCGHYLVEKKFVVAVSRSYVTTATTKKKK